jgi:hypothetical protein
MDRGAADESIQSPIGVVAVLWAGAGRPLSFGAGIPFPFPTLLGKRERPACPFLK